MRLMGFLRFLSTLSLRRATSRRSGSCRRGLFLSTLSLRRATRYSSHCSRVMSDFYPRSPCGERRSCPPSDGRPGAFLSTLSLRRATYRGFTGRGKGQHFYPRSPCGERRAAVGFLFAQLYFYPRSPCGERPAPTQIRLRARTFLSTLSLRRATCLSCLSDRYVHLISIHALLAESDDRSTRAGGELSNFYPRSPCGERPGYTGYRPHPRDISIHALLAESDRWIIFL